MGSGRARGARRLYAAADLDRDRGQSGAVQEPALRSVQGFRADLGAGQRAERALRARRFRHQDARRPGGAGQGRPRQFNYSSPGVGTKSHLTGEQLKLRAGIQMVHVPYRGAGPAALAVLGSTVQVGSVALAAAEPLIKDGQLRALAVTGAKRWFSLPDVPTMIESGYPGFVSDTFNALFAPAGTPPEIVALLARKAAPRSRSRRRASRRARPASRSSPARRSNSRRGWRPKFRRCAISLPRRGSSRSSRNGRLRRHGSRTARFAPVFCRRFALFYPPSVVSRRSG